MLQDPAYQYPKIKKNRTFHTYCRLMRNWLLLLIIPAFLGCDYFDKKKVNADDLLNESLESFNWNEVDDYPIFESCDSTAPDHEKKSCFENTLSKGIYDQLQEAPLIVTESLNDTLYLDFEISSDGQIDYIASNGDAIIYEQIPDIDSLIGLSLSSLPKVYPALKRGQQVKTAFKLPLVLRTD